MKKPALIAIFLSCFCFVNFAWGETFFQETRRLAESGDVNAQDLLGNLYYQGDGVPKNYAEAIKWYRKAAEQGNADSQCSLGFIYRDSQGVPQNYAEAIKWYQKAAEQGDEIAQSSLGMMYLLGQGVPKNFIKSYVWLSIAIASGDEMTNDSFDELSLYVLKDQFKTLTSKMTPQQVAQAQNEAAELWKRINQSKK